MSKEITKGKIRIVFKNGEKIEFERPFKNIKYNFKTATGNRTLDRLEFWISSMEDVSKQEYFDFASKMLNQEENIDSISYNFILVDNTNQTAEEEKELFNSKYLVSKTLVEFDFVAGYNYGKFEDSVENTEYLSSLMQYNFEFM